MFSKKKVTKQVKKTSRKAQQKRLVRVPTDRHDRLDVKKVMRPHNFLSKTNAIMTEILPMEPVSGNTFHPSDEPRYVSAIMKLVLSKVSTNEMLSNWSIALWKINQEAGILPDDCYITFVRAFERQDDEGTKKKIKRRRMVSIMSSSSGDNIKRQGVAVNHDQQLVDAIDKGDSTVGFGAEAIVTAPDEETLETALDAVRNYFVANDETRGLHYEVDINRQLKPFLTYGPNDSDKNREVFEEMTSYEAGESALFVDSGGIREPGSEYVGTSVGKLIHSHSAYNFKNHAALYIGNDTYGKTTTLATNDGDPLDIASQIYLSQVTSRAYLLSGHDVAHFVLDDIGTVPKLMEMPINDSRKVMVDASLGLLNILEAIDNDDNKEHPERIIARFASHLNNIIVLLSQFRDQDKISINDDFAGITREILTDFFVSKKYWSYNAKNDMENLRLTNVIHDQMAKLSDLAAYVQNKVQYPDQSNPKKLAALEELDAIINRNILPTLPFLNAHTDSIVDDLVKAQYRVIDLSSIGMGTIGRVDNPALNTSLIAYLNLVIPNLKNGDAIFLHGLSHASKIARIVQDMIANSGKSLDVIYTEKNQTAADNIMDATSVLTEEADSDGLLKKVARPMEYDFVMVDLYRNSLSKLYTKLGMDRDWVQNLKTAKSSYFIKTENSVDFIFLDKIL